MKGGQRGGREEIIMSVMLTSFEGRLSTSPTPPPFLRPWLSTVTMHMSRVSHVLSIPSSLPSSAAETHKSLENTLLSTPKIIVRQT